MIKINLVPEEILAKEQQRQQGVQVAAVVGAVLALVVMVSVIHVFHANRLERRLKMESQELDKLQKIVAQVEELESTAAAVRARLGVITDLLKGRAMYPYFMADIVQTMPSDIWLTALNTTVKDSNSLGLSISASALAGTAIAEWMRNLQSSGLFSEPSLGTIAATNASGGSRVNTFTISTTYKSSKL